MRAIVSGVVRHTAVDSIGFWKKRGEQQSHHHTAHHHSADPCNQSTFTTTTLPCRPRNLATSQPRNLAHGSRSKRPESICTVTLSMPSCPISPDPNTYYYYRYHYIYYHYHYRQRRDKIQGHARKDETAVAAIALIQLGTGAGR